MSLAKKRNSFKPRKTEFCENFKKNVFGDLTFRISHIKIRKVDFWGSFGKCVPIQVPISPLRVQKRRRNTLKRKRRKKAVNVP